MTFCYLDIPEEVLQQPHDKEMLKLDKKYSFQTSDYVLVYARNLLVSASRNGV